MSQTYQLPKAITLTERAAARVKHIMAKSETPMLGVRLGVKNGGCAGMEYTMDYAEEQLPLDEMVEDKGVTIFIEAKAVLFLLGTEMDYEEGLLSSGFTFNNPNQTDACGCGESVTIIPAAAPPGYKPAKA
ncbi:MAG: iron-sulfur cluster assembly accessory protein [Alphaproteobacteria bacterium]|jgi:iron-sulfur cluster assembly protein|nr:iron-sulfur cluster assembly accessory protein [Alphaproteobacteria bacterium]